MLQADPTMLNHFTSNIKRFVARDDPPSSVPVYPNKMASPDSLDWNTMPTAPIAPNGRLSSSVSHDEHHADTSDHTQLASFHFPRAEIRRHVRSICCIGAGHAGGPTAAVIAYHNPHIPVTVVDSDAARIRRYNSRHLPIFEPGLRHVVRIARDGGRAFDMSTASECVSASRAPRLAEQVEVPARQPNLFFSVEVAKCIAEAGLVFIAVDTPTKLTGVGAGAATDMAAFESVVVEIAQHARHGTIIVEKSTVPCKTAELVRDIMAAHRPGVHFEILSNPEFLAAGTAVEDLLYPDRILIGSSTTRSGRRAARALADVYASWVPRTRIITTNIWSSELSKLVANAMLAQRISSINSISAICEVTGAEIDEVTAAVGSDPRIGDKFLKAGIGFRGSCLKKDVLSLIYLAESLALSDVGDYWRQVITMNENQRERFSRRVMRCLNDNLVGKKITFLGFTFKSNTSDTRESPALNIIKTLLDEKPREIAVFDPHCNPAVIRHEIQMAFRTQDAIGKDRNPVEVYSNIYEACRASNAIIITTECDEFRDARPQALPLPECKPSEDTDPRPFARRELTEMEILALHRFFRSSPLSSEDPLQRYEEESSCIEDCPECKLIQTGRGYANEYDIEGNVDWHRIVYHMKKPKWLFDGRGIIDPEKMTALGIHVESIGRQGKH
ncbi:nucleotide sugar dehydrogenase [Xylaria flabelliformis]|nr:nucleotide sugar dehydrogenase [Xylaria flabelliformis]